MFQNWINLWCDLGKSVWSRTNVTFSVFYIHVYLIEVLIYSSAFCWKLHLHQNWTSGSKEMNDWRILKTIENKRNSFLFLLSHNQCAQLSTDSTRSQHIYLCTVFFMTPLLLLCDVDCQSNGSIEWLKVDFQKLLL